MQYFLALKQGEKRVKISQELLNHYVEGRAMPAIALKDTKNNNWNPVGEENLIATVKEENGFMIVLCDKDGMAKTIAQWFTAEQTKEILSRIKEELNLTKYEGKLFLPI